MTTRLPSLYQSSLEAIKFEYDRLSVVVKEYNREETTQDRKEELQEEIDEAIGSLAYGYDLEYFDEINEEGKIEIHPCMDAERYNKDLYLEIEAECKFDWGIE